MENSDGKFSMGASRLNAFFDAVLAIIMTVLVLNVSAPRQTSFSALWSMRTVFFAYAMSFFWLGNLWVNIVINFSRARQVNRACIWWTLLLLFFCSLMPFSTSYLSASFDSSLPAACYVIVTLLISLVNLRLNHAMQIANCDNQPYMVMNVVQRWGLWADLLIKASGLLIAWLAPSWTLITVFLGLCFPYLLQIHWHRHYKKKIIQEVQKTQEKILDNPPCAADPEMQDAQTGPTQSCLQTPAQTASRPDSRSFSEK